MIRGATLKLRLLDANIVIYASLGNPRVLDAIERLRRGDMALSTLTHSGLLQGFKGDAARSATRPYVEAFARSVTILPYDLAASLAYGELIRAVGFNRSRAPDRMIAAHALALGATLVTAGSASFVDVPGLALEDWRGGYGDAG